MTQSLLAKLQKLDPSSVPAEPSNARQQQAAIYRSSQRETTLSLLMPFQSYLKSLVASSTAEISHRHCLVRLETFINFCEDRNMLPDQLMDGIEANANTRDLEQLRLAGWEQDIWVLLLCSLGLSNSGFSDRLPAYLKVRKEADRSTSDGDHPSQDLMEIVSKAAEVCPGSIWDNEAWTPERVCEYAKILQYDSFLVMCPSSDGHGEEPRLCVYYDGHVQ